MFYAQFINKASETPTVGAMNGRPLNFVIAGFDTQAERSEAINTAWGNGGNGFKVTRKEVEGYYGRDFEMDAKGEINSAGYSETFQIEELEEIANTPRIWEKRAVAA